MLIFNLSIAVNLFQDGTYRNLIRKIAKLIVFLDANVGLYIPLFPPPSNIKTN